MISQPVGMNPRLCEDVRFLVVDDQPHMNELVDLVVSALGAKRVVRVDGGRKALAEIERDAPDILITDYQMDDLDGVALTRAVKAIAGQQVHVIMVTGKKDIEPAAREAGVDVFILKPMWTKSLFEALKAFAGHRTNG